MGFIPDVVTNASKCTDQDCQAVVSRSVKISTKMPTGLVVDVDAILIYEISGTPGGLSIASLRTYWPLAQQSLQVVKAGLLGIRSIVPLSINLFRHLGLRGSLNYAKGFAGVGSAGENTS